MKRIREALTLPTGGGGIMKVVADAHAALGLEPSGPLIQQVDNLLVNIFG